MRSARGGHDMIYFLKASEPIGNPDHPNGTAQFYCGYCDKGKLGSRLRTHAKGRGAKLTRAWIEQGLTFTVVLLIPTGTRSQERKIKNQKNHARFIRRYLKRNPDAWQPRSYTDANLAPFL